MSDQLSATRQGRRRLGELLVDAGVVTTDDLEQALGEQLRDGRRQRLGRVLRDLGMADDEHIATALSAQLGLEVIRGAGLTAATSATLSVVPRRLATRHDLVPVAHDASTGRLTVAMADPTNVVALDDLRTLPAVRSIEVQVALASEVERARAMLYERGAASEAVKELGAELVEEESDDEPEAGDEEPVIRLVNALLADAVRSRASDVHVEPESTGIRVRYRVDGLLREVQHVPRRLAPAVTSRLKIMSNLDIAERRRPQDGRATIRVDGQEVDLRVSTLPSLHGETIVLRLLRKGAERLLMDDLGFDDHQREQFTGAIQRSQGLILMTGPTGSGKTTTLYAGLAELADPTRNVITLEDPVEYQLDGVNQTQINARIGMGFAAGLRAVLRQDPDVVMVGEVRDGETANLAVEASFTGHLVLSTLHTNDAPSTIVRLAELGVERFLLGTSVLLVIAQRLARVVCDDCGEATTPDPAVLRQLGVGQDELAGATPRAGAGCVECDETGYRGRVGLYEFLRMTPRLRQLVADGGSELQIGALARAQGMRSLRQDGIEAALAGRITFEEVLRVTPEDQFRDERETDEGDAATATAIRLGAIESRRVLVLGRGAAEEVSAALPVGWEVSVAGDPDETVARVRAEHPDVVVIGVDGEGDAATAVLRQLRDIDHDGRPVIVRSSQRINGTALGELRTLGVTETLFGDAADGELQGLLLAQVAGR